MIDSNNTWAFLALALAAVCFARAGWLIKTKEKMPSGGAHKC